MSNNKKNNKNKKNRKNFTLEALEPRLMLSATANEAVEDYISSTAFVNYVKQNVTKLDSNPVNLSVDELLKDSFKVLKKDVKVTRDGDSDLYAVTGDVVLSNPSVELSVDINGQSVTGLKGALKTSVKIDSLTLEITEKNNDFSVKDDTVTGDVSLESDIVVGEAAGAKANDGYLDFDEQNVGAESESDLKIKVSSDKNGATVSLDSYDLEFNVQNTKVVTFNPDMKVKGTSTGSSSDFSYANLTLISNVNKSIDDLDNIANCFKNDKTEYIKNIKDGSNDVDWATFAENVRHYAAAAFVARQVAAKTSDDISTLYGEILSKTSWSAFGGNWSLSKDSLVLTKTFNADVDIDLFQKSGISATLEVSLKLSDDSIDVDNVKLSVNEKNVDFETKLGLFNASVEKAEIEFEVGGKYEDGEFKFKSVSGAITSNSAKIEYKDSSNNSKEFDVLQGSSEPLKMTYDSGEWSFSSNLTKYTSITGFSVANEFKVVMTAIDAAVQKLVAEKVGDALSYGYKADNNPSETIYASILDKSISDYVKFLNTDLKQFLDALTVEDAEKNVVAAFTDYEELNTLLQSKLGDTKRFVKIDVTGNKIGVSIDFSKVINFDFANSGIKIDLSKAISQVNLSSNAEVKFSGDGALGFTINISFDNAGVDENSSFSTISQNAVVQNTQAIELVKGQIFLPNNASWELIKVGDDSVRQASSLTLGSYAGVDAIVSKLKKQNTTSSYTYDSIGKSKLVVYSDSEFTIESNGENNAFSVLGFSEGHWAKKIIETTNADITVDGKTLSLKTDAKTGQVLADYLNEQLVEDAENSLSYLYGLYAICLDDGSVFVVCDRARANFSTNTDTLANLEKNFGPKNSNSSYIYISSDLEYKAIIDSKITVNLGSKKVEISTGIPNVYSSLVLLAKDINKCLENEFSGKDISAVVENNSIILRTSCDSSTDKLSASVGESAVQCQSYSHGSSEFMINDEYVDVDLSSVTYVKDVCSVIQSELNNLKKSDVKIDYEDGSFILSSKSSFTISSVLGCDLLKVLGFGTNSISAKYDSGSNGYYVKGASLGFQDLTERFTFNVDTLEINLRGDTNNYTNVEISDETDLSVGEDGFLISELKCNDEIKNNTYAYVIIDGEYYKIVKNSTQINNDTFSVKIEKKSLNQTELKKAALLKNDKIKFVANASISLNANFVEASVFAAGGFNIAVSYSNKTDTFDTKDNSDNSFANTLSNVNVDVSGSIDLDGYLSIGNISSLFSIGSVTAKSGGLDVSGLSINASDVLKNLENFSVETVLSMLENLASNASNAISGLDVSIPLINKRVNDIVKVGENLSQIVAELRNADVLSVQSLQVLVNKFLFDANLIKAEYKENKLVYIGGLVLSVNASNQLEVSLSFNKEIRGESSFSFGKYLSGSAKLILSGGISVELKGHFEKTTFMLDQEISLDANIDLCIDKPSFALSLPELSLNGIISVGPSKSGDLSNLKAKFIAVAGIGAKNAKLTNLSLGSFDYGYDFGLSGDLYVYTGDICLGGITIRKYNEGTIADFTSLNSATIKIINGDKIEYKKNAVSESNFVFKIKDEAIPQKGAAIVIDASAMSAAIKQITSTLTQGNLYEKLKLAVSGLDSFLDIVDSSMNDGLGKKLKELPVAGNAISSGAEFIADLHKNIIEPLANLVYSSPNLDAKSMAGYFCGWLKPFAKGVTFDIKTLGGTWTKSDKGDFVYYKTSKDNSSAEWFFTLGGTYSIGKDLDFDLGFPGLGLKGQGGVDLNLVWSLNFGIGISETKGFYLVLLDGEELNVAVNIKLADKAKESSIYGQMAGLGVKLSNKVENTCLDEVAGASFEIDLNKNDTPAQPQDGEDDSKTFAKNIGEILSKAPDFSWNATVALKYQIEVGVVGKNGVSGNFPNITGVFDFAWNNEKKVTSLGFSSMQVSLGSFIQKTLGPVISQIKTVLDPIKPYVDFLVSPFPVLDDLGLSISPLDLAKLCNPDIKVDFIYAMQDLLVLADKINAVSGDKKIALPDLQLMQFGSPALKDASDAFLNGSGKLSAITNKITDYFDKFDDFKKKYKIGSFQELKNLFSEEMNKSVNSSGVNCGFTSGQCEWTFFWNDPSQIYELLLGKDIPLVTFHMPELDFHFNWDEFFPVLGPLGVRASVTFGAKADFTFGYDTLGVRQWVKSDFKDAGKLMNGFYIDNSNGKPELTFYGGLSASAELNIGAKAGVGGGVDIGIYLDVYDPSGDGKLRIGEIKEIISELSALSLFNVKGEVTAQLSAYVKFLFYTKRWNITSKITLLSFKVEHDMPAVLASETDGNVIANVGDSAEARIINTSDVNEDASYTIKNGNVVTWGGSNKKLSVKDGKFFKIDAKDGNDKITIKSEGKDPAKINILIDAGEGNDEIDLSGLDLAEGCYVVVVGGAGNDKIKGAKGKGKNIIFGDSAVFVYDENGNIVGIQEVPVDSGNSGEDYIDLSYSESDNNIAFGGAGNDQILGGKGNDILIGDGGKVDIKFTDSSFANANVTRTSLSNEGGNDIIYGGEGNDVIYAGAGSDFVHGGAGDDVIYGEKGDDHIWGGSGTDEIHGEAGMDVLIGDALPSNGKEASATDIDTLFGKEIRKVLSEDFNKAYGKGSISKGVLNAGWFENQPSDDLESAKDYIYGNDGQDVIIAGGGDDIVEGGAGNDVIHGEAGNDKLSGGLDNDVIYGGEGSDLIYGESGNDMLYGDNGIVDITQGTKLTGDIEISFGTNLGLLGVDLTSLEKNKDSDGQIQLDATSKGAKDGNDKIFTGSGMDFADGQGGDDEVTVEFMGDSTLGYANVFDSGSSSGDALIVNGTNYNDKLLIRASDKGVGFVALMPNSNDSENAVKNTNIERVNFSAKSDFVQVNMGDGNDSVSVDGTLTDVAINGGAGNDSFQIGQLYQSKRDGSAHVAENDKFSTVRTSDGYVSEGVGAGTSLTLNGEEGEDNFNLLHSVGDTNMFGGADNDDFTINGLTYDKVAGKSGTVENGAIGIDGGAGTDTMIMNGTRGDDTFVLTEDGLVSDIAAVEAVGVEETRVNAGDGDDLYYLISSKADNEVSLNGGNGNDTFAAGGMPEQSFKTTNVEGKTQSVTFEKDGKEIIDSFTIVDTEKPVVYLQNNSGDFISSVSVNESGVSGAITVGYAGEIDEDDTVEVTISIPRVSKTALQSGNRGIGLSESNNGTYSNTITLKLTKTASTATFYVYALEDYLAEGTVTTGLIIKSKLVPKTGGSTSLKQVSMAVEVSDKSSGDDKGLIAKTVSYGLDASNPSVKLEDGSAGLASVFVDGYARKLAYTKDYSIDDAGVLTITNADVKKYLADADQPTLYVHYRTNKMDVQGSSVSLAYSEYKEGTTFKVTLDNTEIRTLNGVKEGDEYYYVRSGSTITFYSVATKRQVAVNGTVEISATAVKPTNSNASVSTPVNSNVGFTVTKSREKVYESSASSKGDAEDYSYVEYTVTLAQKLKKDDTASITMKLGGANLVVDGNLKNDGDGNYTITFTGTDSTEADKVTFKVYALKGSCNSTETAKKTIKAHENRIDEIRGSVIVKGFGAAGGINAGTTVILDEYNHKLTDGKEAMPETNELKKGDSFAVPPSDSAEGDNANTDRLIVNNQQSTKDDSKTKLTAGTNDDESVNEESLRFTNSDLASEKGITAVETEFAEFNLGQGKDTVNIAKTLYRQDGFQTFTVVNTGDAASDTAEDDEITIESYGDTDGQLVVNAQGGKDNVTATSDKITKDGMIVFGGSGADTIDVAKGVIALGDKGNIQYKKGNDVVTDLGYDNAGEIIYTRVEKDTSGKLQKQTDGVARGASSIKSVQPSEGANDSVTAGGKDSVIIGGFGADKITVTGDENVVLGDNGEVKFVSDESSRTSWKVESGLSSVETIENSIGSIDTINITGSHNVVMGGADGDTININRESAEKGGSDNVVLGDGGKAAFDPSVAKVGDMNVSAGIVSVATADDSVGKKDTIVIHGGQNTVMGGVAGDEIELYGDDNIVLGDGGESVREWNADNKVFDAIKYVKTTNDDNGDADTINIHGGKNAVMGGAAGDKIEIGDQNKNNGNENVVLGDGGSYVVDKTNKEVTVATSREVKDGKVVIYGDVDTINIHGGQNTVMGGAAGDKIELYGDDNIVLGDGGESVREWNAENKVFDAIKSVKTTDDDNGGEDIINIHGGKNAVMGGAVDDKINIGDEGKGNGNINVVLGDGGSYVVDKTKKEVVVETSREIKDDEVIIHGGVDTINIHGGENTVMGGTAGDEINVYGDDNVVLGDGGIAVREWKENSGIFDNLKNVATTDDSDGGVDTINIYGGRNVAMGGMDGDLIDIKGADNVVVGDGGRYDVYDTYRTVVTKSEQDGGHDIINTADGKNIVMGGMDNDEITTGSGNDIILGDGGFARVDKTFNPIYVTNAGFNTGDDLGTAGDDVIVAGDGDNVVFGGLDGELNKDDITTGSGDDVVFGDNGYATFDGNGDIVKNVDLDNKPTVYEEATLSFNFQGNMQHGIDANDTVGAPEYASQNWNNIGGGHLASTYGNDDNELVRFDNGTRASAVSVSYGASEDHRISSTDVNINLQNYNLGLWNTEQDKNAKLMNSGVMTPGNNDQHNNMLNVSVDGLAQYFTSYKVVVYLDLPEANSWAGQSVRLVSLFINGERKQAYYVNDFAGEDYGKYRYDSQGNRSLIGFESAVDNAVDANGNLITLTADSARNVKYANYVVFDVPADIAADRIVVTIEDGYKEPNYNGKDIPGIAGIQVKGKLHKQDVAASTDIEHGGNDVIKTNGGDDIVVGGTGSDHITTYGDERYGIYDNDVVFGDNAKMVFADRDNNAATASTLSSAESVAVTKIENGLYDDTINTGDGNDTVVGGVGRDTINAGATDAAEAQMDNINVLSINFTREYSDSSDEVATGEFAGVVADDNWHNFYRNERGVVVSEDAHDRNLQNTQDYSRKMDFLSNHPDAEEDNPYAVAEDVEVRLFGMNHNNPQTASSFTIENYSELDGDTSNSKLFNTYIATQQSDEIVLKLKNMESFVSNSNNSIDSSFDLYVYLGGDNDDTDTYNYIYEIALNIDGKTYTRYLNDWVGRTFDGDYLEARCSSLTEAMNALHEGAAPLVGLVGNYVVFRGVSGNLCDIRIKNVYTGGGQNPKNLPLITAIQAVSGDGRYQEAETGKLKFNDKTYNYADIAIGGDHDKDLVYGDDAKLTFDLDIPYAANESIADYKNRVIEAKSIAIENNAVTHISTEDTIITGKDRDVVVGGEGSDTIITGAGDDVVLGGSANLMVEHNNPIGVFTPNVEIVLDQHTIDTTKHRNYLDNDNADVNSFERRIEQNGFVGVEHVDNQNDRIDNIDAGEGRNLVSQDNWNNSELVVHQEETPVVNPDENNGESGNQQSQTGETEDDGVIKQYVLDKRDQGRDISIKAGETIMLVLTDWLKGNQWYQPNVLLKVDLLNGDNLTHTLMVNWNDHAEVVTITENWINVDIPDSANVDGEEKIVLLVTSPEDLNIKVTVTNS